MFNTLFVAIFYTFDVAVSFSAEYTHIYKLCARVYCQLVYILYSNVYTSHPPVTL